ncbi:MAG: adenosylcobinamide-GDP ribazoletransferase [Proteobacteria bacterium]|nr:adenosylcobinamide-GDP ribazoletransferase [Pseudomonadota bacterium]
MIATWLRAFTTGVQFLTRLPVPGGASADSAGFEADFPRALTLFPLIGGLIGALTAAVLALAAQLWPLPLAVLVALAAEALLTGALHEDAVADVCDAFGGGRTRDDVLRILKDSRVGSFGVTGLALALALRAGGLMAAGGTGRAALALVVSGMTGRLALLVLAALAPPDPGRVGLARAVADHARWRTVGLGIACASPVLLLAGVTAPVAACAGLAASGAFAWWFSRVVRRRIGGATGDCLGATAYAGVVLSTLAFAARP